MGDEAQRRKRSKPSAGVQLRQVWAKMCPLPRGRGFGYTNMLRTA